MSQITPNLSIVSLNAPSTLSPEGIPADGALSCADYVSPRLWSQLFAGQWNPAPDWMKASVPPLAPGTANQHGRADGVSKGKTQ